jgi:hypothetical protein
MSDGAVPGAAKPTEQAVPRGERSSATLPAPTPLPERPPAFILPSPEYDLEPSPTGSHPLVDRPEAAGPGYFFNVESSVLAIHVQNKLLGGSVSQFNLGIQAPSGGLPFTGDLIAFDGNKLDPTVSPRFEMGYRFGEGWGSLRLSYRFMDTKGSDIVDVAPPRSPNDLELAAQTGRLDVNIIDLDYSTEEFALWPDWEMRTAVGVRYATTYYDSRVQFLNPITLNEIPFGTGPFTRLTQSEEVSHWFLGAHTVMELGRKLCDSGFTLFGRVEACGLYGVVCTDASIRHSRKPLSRPRVSPVRGSLTALATSWSPGKPASVTKSHSGTIAGS